MPRNYHATAKGDAKHHKCGGRGWPFSARSPASSGALTPRARSKTPTPKPSHNGHRSPQSRPGGQAGGPRHPIWPEGGPWASQRLQTPGEDVRARPPARSRSQRQGQDHALGALPEPPDPEGRAYGVVTARRWRCLKRSSGFSTTIVAGSASRATKRSRQQPIAPARPSPRRCRRWRTRGFFMGSADQARPRTLS